MICVFHRLCSINWQNNYQWETKPNATVVCFKLQPKQTYENDKENYEMSNAYLQYASG